MSELGRGRGRGRFGHRSSHSVPAPLPAAPAPQEFSKASDPAVPDSLWFASDFLLGASMVILQPSTKKCVLVYESQRKYWFLPKGRKDVGESIEEAALREVYEESGYRAQFLPLYTPSRAPLPPHSASASQPSPSLPLKNTEPISVGTYTWRPKFAKNADGSFRKTDHGGEYLTFFYVGQIPEDAVRETDTGMADEKNYVSYLLTFDEACERLADVPREMRVLQMAWSLWMETLEIDRRLGWKAEREATERNAEESRGPDVNWWSWKGKKRASGGKREG